MEPAWRRLLGGALRKAAEAGERRKASKQDSRSTAKQLEAYEAFCGELGEEPADVALAWLLHNPVVTAPIIGPRTIEQLDGSLRALEIKLIGRRSGTAGRDLARPGRRGARSLRLVRLLCWRHPAIVTQLPGAGPSWESRGRVSDPPPHAPHPEPPARRPVAQGIGAAWIRICPMPPSTRSWTRFSAEA